MRKSCSLVMESKHPSMTGTTTRTSIYMAHHDHLGLGAERDENADNIYNGAVDNAAGAAALLAIAKAYSQLDRRPPRFEAARFVVTRFIGSRAGAPHICGHQARMRSLRTRSRHSIR